MNIYKLVLLMGMFVNGLLAAVQGVPNLRDLSSQAEIVAVGTVFSSTSVRLNNPNPEKTMTSISAELQVLRTVSGTLAPNRQVSVKWDQAGTVAGSPLPKDDLGMWFLRKTPDGSWTPLSFVAQPRMVDDVRIAVESAQLGQGFEYGAAVPVADRVLLEVLSAAFVDSRNRFNYVHWGAFDELAPSIMERFYRRLAVQPTVDRQAKGLAGLIRLGRGDGLLSFERELPRLTANIDVVAFSIAAYFRTGDNASVAALGRLVSPSSPSAVRKAAAQSLAYIHNDRCLPYLASLLESGELELEVLGAGGLAMFANGVRVIGKGADVHFSPSGAPGPFRSDETIRNFTLDAERFSRDRGVYTQFWRSWWNNNRAAATATP